MGVDSGRSTTNDTATTTMAVCRAMRSGLARLRVMASSPVTICPLSAWHDALYCLPTMARIVPAAQPDFAASPWLTFGDHRAVPGDPPSQAAFTAAYACLAAMTYYFTEINGPWFAATAAEVREVYADFIRGMGLGRTGVQMRVSSSSHFTLRHLQAVSTRRMHAVTEFGGDQRDDYPILVHVHGIIGQAVGRSPRTQMVPTACPASENSNEVGQTRAG